MAFYFFADIGALDSQSDFQFGPTENTSIAGVEYEQFLVTSRHTGQNDLDAVAICRGQIIVQEQTDNQSLLNILLKPIDNLPFVFPGIKYYLYKGIKKSSLVASNDTDIAQRDSNDLINSIWAFFDKRNYTTNPTKELLGLNDSIDSLIDTIDLDDIFESSSLDVQFWSVQPGNKIGKFDKDAIGFEIITNSLLHKPKLAVLRNASTFIQVQTLSSTPTQKDFFEHWHKKEAILGFIDPCSLFSEFYNKEISVFVDGVVNKWQGDDINQNLLLKFANKGLCYLDIRNEFNNSINYLKNYGPSSVDNTTNIQIKKNEELGFYNINYYSNGWPILVIDKNNFNESLRNFQSLSIKMPCSNDENPSPLIYLDIASKPSDNFPTGFSQKEKFVDGLITDSYTQELEVGLPWADDNLLNKLTRLKLVRKTTNENLLPATDANIRRMDYLDCLFPLQINYDFANSTLTTKVFDENIYLDVSETHFFDAAFNLGISFTGGNVTLFANPNIINQNDRNKERQTLELVGDWKFGNETSDNLLFNLSEDDLSSNLVTNVLFKGEDELHVLEFQTSGADIEGQFSVPDIRKILSLNFTIEQWNNIVSIANSNFLMDYWVFLGITNKLVLEDDNQVNYTSMDIIIKGFQVTDNSLSVQEATTNLTVIAYGVV
ncbi:hypothetical protein KXD93_22480 [Mucilaginibacter sp. BJC16-A38]|uniref:hypothetical protein n=1 Tax=Mucilaginibacter phenanthrenivorans TaxID=1234842 RepID=UPI002158740A|nr:hypothetical protein [Mucilaginibacter phenanthrenivorans]MCR8560438.1 hypothetical protein [Mucilaginibacter phenanthrenivorans]